MVALWAPVYACLHLGWWEESSVYCSLMYLCHVCFWLKYIDNVLVIWDGTADELHDLNIKDRNIRLTYTWDAKKTLLPGFVYI